jgi:chromate transporter
MSRPEIALIFLRIGALAFGGLGATLALIERELVARRAVLSKQDMTEALAYTKLLPGSTVVQIVAYLGWRLSGWTGSALATTAFILPSAVFMVVLAAGYARTANVPAAVGVRLGILAVVVALLVLTMERLARPLITGWFPITIAAGAFLVCFIFDVSAVWAVVVAGLLGIVTDKRTP